MIAKKKKWGAAWYFIQIHTLEGDRQFRLFFNTPGEAWKDAVTLANELHGIIRICRPSKKQENT